MKTSAQPIHLSHSSPAALTQGPAWRDRLDEWRAGFHRPDGSRAELAREAKDMRGNLSERQIDKTLADSFPASDPPAWY